MNQPIGNPGTVDREVELIIEEVKPHLREMVLRSGSSVKGITFDDIEANAASVGDLLARLIMIRSVKGHSNTAPDQARSIRQEALEKAAPELAAGFEPDELRVTRQKRKRKLKTARGEIVISRDYFYFPDLKVGLFPPRHTSAVPRRRSDPSS